MKNWWMYIFLVLLLIAPIELASLLAVKILGQQNIVLESPDTQGYDEYLLQRDPVLGWPSPSAIGTGEFDTSGSRIVPAFPDPNNQTCVSAYGDSFTWGDEVPPSKSYPNALSVMLDCRVSNFGIGGYGSDQAFLRYKFNELDNAETVVLGHYSDNIVRNVNQLRDFYAHSRFGFKPRLVLDERGELRLIPIPTLTAEQYKLAFDSPELFLQHEYVMPGRTGGPVKARFPYTITVGRALSHYRIQARLRGNPSYAAFYSNDHPSGALALTAAIVGDFFSEAESRGQHPLFLVVPDIQDLRILERGEDPPYVALVMRLRELGIEAIDGGAGIMAQLEGNEICDLYVACGHGHFNGKGYAMIAKLIYERMTSEKLLSAPPTRSN